jgi:hypothetical protein
MGRSGKVTLVVTAFAVVYQILHILGAGESMLFILFMLSPFAMGWLVITVLKDKSVPTRDLEEDEEWGYNDYTPGSSNGN